MIDINFDAKNVTQNIVNEIQEISEKLAELDKSEKLISGKNTESLEVFILFSNKIKEIERKKEILLNIDRSMLNQRHEFILEILEEIINLVNIDRVTFVNVNSECLAHFPEFGEKAKELRRIAQDLKRRVTILSLSEDELPIIDLGDIWVIISWMKVNGTRIHLNLLKNFRKNWTKLVDKIWKNNSSSFNMLSLLNNAINEISYREGLTSQRYIIYCSKQQFSSSFPELKIVQEYNSFVVVDTDKESLQNLKLNFPHCPIETYKVRSPDQGKPDNVLNIENPGIVLMENVVVHFSAPVMEAWKKNLEDLGANILQALGGSSFVVSIPSKEVEESIISLDEVASVEAFTPKITVEPENFRKVNQKITDESIAEARFVTGNLFEQRESSRAMTVPGLLIADFFTVEYRDHAITDLNQRGIKITSQPTETSLILDLGSSQNIDRDLETIQRLAGLSTLDEYYLDTIFNDVARPLIASGVIPSNPHPDIDSLNLTGQGEVIAIADTGLDTGDPETVHLDFHGRVRDIKKYPIKSFFEDKVSGSTVSDGADKYSGHGTHVAGSALGNGLQAERLNIPPIKGIAYEAELFFQALEQTPIWNQDGLQYWRERRQPPPTSGNLLGIPDDLKLLLADAYQEKARIYSMSWGGGKFAEYSPKCKAVDQFVKEHPDFLVVVAAGNAGRITRPGMRSIDQPSVDPPGTAKNCLTVGASENDRLGEFDDTYGQRSPDKFPYEPFRTEDCLVDSVDDIAAFSSRGPCSDQRYKPEVIAPGTYVLSTRSSQLPHNHFADGYYSPAKMHYMFSSGTSMATPLVAGCAALVRQYLRTKHQPSFSSPSAALLKASLIHSAEYINYRYAHPASRPWADNEQGWGRISLKNVLNPTSPTQVHFIDETRSLVTGESHFYNLELSDNTVPLRVTLVYSDEPGPTLINNLNLIISSPEGRYYFGNDFLAWESSDVTPKPDNINNVEGFVMESPALGVWRLQIVASEINVGQQDYALVISGGGLVCTVL